MHRAILNVPKGYKTDHRNHNGLDNRKQNLRIATNSENQQNQKIRKNGTSQYKGVSWNSKHKLWYAQIKLNNKVKWLGDYKNEIEAAKAYDEAAKELFGEFALTNF